MQLRRFAGVGEFLEAAGPFLAAREAEHNLILGVTSNLREAPEEFSAPPYLATVSAGGRVVAVAMQTPPFNLVLSEIDDPAAIACLADDLVDRDLPGALGPVEHVRAFVEARTARGGAPGSAPHLRADLSADRGALTDAVGARPAPGGWCGGSGARPRLDRGVPSRGARARHAVRARGPDRSLARRSRSHRSTSGRTARSSRWPASAVPRRTGSGSGRSTRRPSAVATATRVPWSPR